MGDYGVSFVCKFRVIFFWCNRKGKVTFEHTYVYIALLDDGHSSLLRVHVNVEVGTSQSCLCIWTVDFMRVIPPRGMQDFMKSKRPI